jgi:hypothetical protein
MNRACLATFALIQQAIEALYRAGAIGAKMNENEPLGCTHLHQPLIAPNLIGSSGDARADGNHRAG